jgi:hypothetical protein
LFQIGVDPDQLGVMPLKGSIGLGKCRRLFLNTPFQGFVHVQKSCLRSPTRRSAAADQRG